MQKSMLPGKQYKETSDRAIQKCSLYIWRPSFRAFGTQGANENVKEKPNVTNIPTPGFVFLSVFLTLKSLCIKSKSFLGTALCTNYTLAVVLFVSCTNLRDAPLSNIVSRWCPDTDWMLQAQSTLFADSTRNLSFPLRDRHRIGLKVSQNHRQRTFPKNILSSCGIPYMLL